MAVSFEVVDLRNNLIAVSSIIEGANSPEEAARRALGMEVFRSGRREDLVARVYWQTEGSPRSMVRLYFRPHGGGLGETPPR